MRATAFSWLGAACVACAVAAGGLELHAEAAEGRTVSTTPTPASARQAPGRAPKLGALSLLHTAPAVRTTPVLPPAAPSAIPAGTGAVPNRAAPSAEPAIPDTRMSEEEAALYLAQAWQSVLGKVPPSPALSLLWAHWAHETGRGRRMYGFNFGGLKGRGPEGAGFLTWTREAAGDTRTLVQRTFRAYPSAEAGARDYLELLLERFPSALRAARRGDVARFVEVLSNRGYFTDDEQAYQKAIASLNFECRRRRLAETALLRLPLERSPK